jgi:ADP-ribosyl-[dinitrogen reductase] hydrolase
MGSKALKKTAGGSRSEDPLAARARPGGWPPAAGEGIDGSVTLQERIGGGLVGLAAGDALGSTLEFLTADEVRRRHGGDHRELTGGGAFGWRPGQGTDDTDLAWAVAKAYVDGYSLQRAARGMLAWYEGGPADVGTTTAAALGEYRRSHDPRRSGQLAAKQLELSAGNGSLMRALPTGLVRTDSHQRRREAAELSAVTHADPRAVDACVAYVELVAQLMEGAAPEAAVESVLADDSLRGDVRQVMADAPELAAGALDTSGFVLATLSVAVWALLRPGSFEDVLVEVVNLGGDADTTGAVAGGLLGVNHGVAAVPERWIEALEYGPTLLAAVPRLTTLRRTLAGGVVDTPRMDLTPRGVPAGALAAARPRGEVPACEICGEADVEVFCECCCQELCAPCWADGDDVCGPCLGLGADQRPAKTVEAWAAVL